MIFGIKARYQSGNSFNTYLTENTINLVWTKPELALQALQELKDHFDFCDDLSHQYGANKELYMNEYRKKSYYNPQCKHLNDIEYIGCMLETDDGDRRIANTSMYMGYFEHLHSLELYIKDGKVEF